MCFALHNFAACSEIQCRCAIARRARSYFDLQCFQRYTTLYHVVAIGETYALFATITEQCCAMRCCATLCHVTPLHGAVPVQHASPRMFTSPNRCQHVSNSKPNAVLRIFRRPTQHVHQMSRRISRLRSVQELAPSVLINIPFLALPLQPKPVKGLAGVGVAGRQASSRSPFAFKGNEESSNMKAYEGGSAVQYLSVALMYLDHSQFEHQTGSS